MDTEVRKENLMLTDTPFVYADHLGPKSIHHFYEPATGLKAILVVDNVAAGPAIGGCRMAPDVSLDECFRLARAMTFKNAAAGLRHGGAPGLGDQDVGLPPVAIKMCLPSMICGFPFPAISMRRESMNLPCP